MANLVTAYILWFFLGIFGVHHFYLKRDRQAFVWWATLGGFFGLGWFRDFWHLPRYVKEANEDEKGYVEENVDRVNQGAVNENRQDEDRPIGRNPPKPSGARFGGMLLMGYILGNLAMFIFPQEVYKYGNQTLVKAFLLVVPPGAVAIGVHLVANIGRLKVSMSCCLLGSAAGVIWLYGNMTNIGGSCLLSTLSAYYWGRKWKTFRRRKSKCKRMSVLFAYGMVYLSMWGTSLYFNATITSSDGENIPLREAVGNFFTSPAWTETKKTLHLMWQHIKQNGFSNFFQQVVLTMDPEGEASAYKVLGVTETSSQEEIKVRYRQLAKEWHPDKQKDPAKKAQAQEKFLHIQKAYETLSKIKGRRSRKNQRQSRNDEL
ncbi:hypothetical protein ACOMHN_026738 [Nucella lapillus]